MLYLPAGWVPRRHRRRRLPDRLRFAFRAPRPAGLAPMALQRAGRGRPRCECRPDAARAGAALRSTPIRRTCGDRLAARSHPVSLKRFVPRRRKLRPRPMYPGPAAGTSAKRVSEPKRETWFERAAPARLVGASFSTGEAACSTTTPRLSSTARLFVPRPGCHTDARLRRCPPPRAGRARPPERGGPAGCSNAGPRPDGAEANENERGDSDE
jgi:hypothetical protein